MAVTGGLMANALIARGAGWLRGAGAGWLRGAGGMIMIFADLLLSWGH